MVQTIWNIKLEMTQWDIKFNRSNIKYKLKLVLMWCTKLVICYFSRIRKLGHRSTLTIQSSLLHIHSHNTTNVIWVKFVFHGMLAGWYKYNIALFDHWITLKGISSVVGCKSRGQFDTDASRVTKVHTSCSLRSHHKTENVTQHDCMTHNWFY